MTPKRLFDILFSIIALFVFGGLIFLGYFIAIIDTSSNGFFTQKRIGKQGKKFTIYKLKTIHPKTGNTSRIGLFFRKYKLDELPQLLNILIGNMSFVGPRPDIEGYYDVLKGEQKMILTLKPGLTCPASIKYRNEEELLASHPNPQKYNDEIIFPDKLKMNLEYYYHNTLLVDMKIMFETLKKVL